MPAPTPLVFITGASSGIGLALAQRYLREGWRLALVARQTSDLQAWALQQGLGEDQCRVYTADVTNTASIARAGQACQAAQGLPDVVIACAGVSIGVDTAEFEDLAVIAQTYATNVVGMAATFQPFISPMRQRGSGTLVGIGSVAGIRGLPGHGAYCASKAAVISYCESLRGELAPAGLRVVTICPGYVDTPLTRKNRYPMPFLMTPEQFASACFRVICSGASYRVIPWQMGVVARLLRLLPNPVFDRLLRGRPRKHRLGQ